MIQEKPMQVQAMREFRKRVLVIQKRVLERIREQPGHGVMMVVEREMGMIQKWVWEIRKWVLVIPMWELEIQMLVLVIRMRVLAIQMWVLERIPNR